MSDIDGRSDLPFAPEIAFGFRSGSPSDFVIDRAGSVRAGVADRAALPGRLVRLLAER